MSVNEYYCTALDDNTFGLPDSSQQYDEDVGSLIENMVRHVEYSWVRICLTSATLSASSASLRVPNGLQLQRDWCGRNGVMIVVVMRNPAGPVTYIRTYLSRSNRTCQE